jgi:hypothetical protein
VTGADWAATRDFARRFADGLALGPDQGRLGVEHFGDASLTHFATELTSDKAALLENLDSLAASARVPGSRSVEQVILGVHSEFASLGRPDAQKALVILAGGPPEDSPFEKAWLLKEQLNCTVLVITPQPSGGSPGDVLGSGLTYDSVASSPALGKYILPEQSFAAAADKVDQYIPILQVCDYNGTTPPGWADILDKGLDPNGPTTTTTPTSTWEDIMVQFRGPAPRSSRSAPDPTPGPCREYCRNIGNTSNNWEVICQLYDTDCRGCPECAGPTTEQPVEQPAEPTMKPTMEPLSPSTLGPTVAPSTLGPTVAPNGLTLAPTTTTTASTSPPDDCGECVGGIANFTIRSGGDLRTASSSDRCSVHRFFGGQPLNIWGRSVEHLFEDNVKIDTASFKFFLEDCGSKSDRAGSSSCAFTDYAS